MSGISVLTPLRVGTGAFVRCEGFPIYGAGIFHALHSHYKCLIPALRCPQFGLATIILSFLMPVWGLVSFRRMGIIQRFPERLQPLIKMMHRQLGLVTWLLALMTIELALPHPAVYKRHITVLWQGGVGLLAVLVGVLSYKAVVGPKQIGGPEDTLCKTV